MLLYIFFLLIGFLILFKSADQFVIGSIASAKNFNVSPMVIGLTVVALGTSAPEIFVAAAASLSNQPELAVGNAIGSNIANLGMVLGITALIAPLTIPKETLRHDLPIVIIVSIGAGLILMDLKLDIWEGVILIIGLVLFVARIAYIHKKGNDDQNTCLDLDEIDEVDKMSNLKATYYVISGLVFLLVSSEILVYSVIEIARLMGISELLIGLSVIAVGTSLPELVVSVTSAIKGETELALGNIMGSNIFNILAVLAIPSIISPTALNPDLLWRDYIVMLGITLAITLFAYFGKPKITRIKGVVLLILWSAYIGVLYQAAIGGNQLNTWLNL